MLLNSIDARLQLAGSAYRILEKAISRKQWRSWLKGSEWRLEKLERVLGILVQHDLIAEGLVRVAAHTSVQRRRLPDGLPVEHIDDLKALLASATAATMISDIPGGQLQSRELPATRSEALDVLTRIATLHEEPENEELCLIIAEAEFDRSHLLSVLGKVEQYRRAAGNARVLLESYGDPARQCFARPAAKQVELQVNALVREAHAVLETKLRRPDEARRKLDTAHRLGSRAPGQLAGRLLTGLARERGRVLIAGHQPEAAVSILGPAYRTYAGHCKSDDAILQVTCGEMLIRALTIAGRPQEGLRLGERLVLLLPEVNLGPTHTMVLLDALSLAYQAVGALDTVRELRDQWNRIGREAGLTTARHSL